MVGLVVLSCWRWLYLVEVDFAATQLALGDYKTVGMGLRNWSYTGTRREGGPLVFFSMYGLAEYFTRRKKHFSRFTDRHT